MKATLALGALVALIAGCSEPALPAPRSPAIARMTYGPGDVWLEPPRLYGNAIYFDDELAAVGDALAELLARPPYGYRVIPNQRLRTLFSQAQQGWLPGATQVCEVAPPPSRLAQVLFSGAAQGELEVRCAGETCELTVILQQRPPLVPGQSLDDRESTQEVLRLGARLPLKDGPVGWAQALRQNALVRLPPPEPTGGLGIIGGLVGARSGPGVYAVLSSLQSQGAWSQPLESSTFQPHAVALNSCGEGKQWRDFWGQPYLIEVSPAGRISRCEPAYSDHLPPPGFECRCQILRERVDLGAGPAGRRARFDLSLVVRKPGRGLPYDGLHRRVYLSKARSPDATAVLDSRVTDGEALARCLEPHKQRLPEVNVPVEFQVAPDGRATLSAAGWPPGLLAPETLSCMTRVLQRAHFNCPVGGQPVPVMATLRISIEPYGRPIP